MKYLLSRTTIAASLLLAFGSSFAAEPANDSNVFKLGEINVAGTGTSNPAVGGSTVTREDLDDFNREVVVDALNLLPGITTTGGGQRNERMVTVRGFDSRQVPVFIDGIPVYVPYDGNVDMARFTTYDLASIEVAKGFSSVLYGSNTIGGAINLVTRRPAKEFEGNIGVGIRSNDKFNSNGKSTNVNLGTNQGLWYAQLGLSYLDRDGYTMSRDYRPVAAQPDRERRNAYNTDKKINIKIGFTPNATDEYALNYVNQKGEKGSPPYAGTIDRARYWQWPAWDKESLYFISNTAIGQNSYIKTRVYYDKFTNSLAIFGNANYNQATSRSFYDDHTYGGSVEYGTKISDVNTLKVSMHLKEDVHKEHDQGGPEQRSADRTTSLGIEDTHKLTNKLDLVVGASYDQRKEKQGQKFANGAMTNFPVKDTSAFNPQAGLIYHTSETGNAYFTIARKSRFPTIKQRYSAGMGTAIPNPGLNVERAINYQLGISEKLTSKVRVDAAIFYSDITDMMQSNVVPGTFCAQSTNAGRACNQMQNIGKVSSKGIELGLTAAVSNTLELGGNYTYLDRKNKSDSKLLTDAPAHKLFTYAKWAATPSMNVIGSAEYNSKRWSNDSGTRAAEGFGIVNAKLSYNLQKGVTLEAGVNNLLDRNYAYSEGYYEEGRNFFANMNYRF
ncbi:TonB-dependent receptor [Herminiimonas sp. KBW02]|uniref:TonB-dependent receptor plug domain-containing protein n=1 Tax=Herminiimonas sp. KBW02 TaxID=2153363 RepID=UPI000F5AEB2B|nr:TonB-dependent receptor [Herminiimonas sp. KBW02]RQO37190.1 TonB-dependent receptor [Herminiimonas sp. KBW02]